MTLFVSCMRIPGKQVLGFIAFVIVIAGLGGAPHLAQNPHCVKALQNSKEDSDVAAEGLNGHVKTVRQFAYLPQLKFDEWELGSPSTVQNDEYDDRGFFKTSKLQVLRGTETPNDIALRDLDNHYFPETEPRISYITFVYDFEKGTVLVERKTGTNPNDLELSERYTLKKCDMEETRFDEIGNIEWKEVTQKEPDGAVIRSTYDSDGKLLERETSNKDESIIENFEYGSKSKKRRYSNGLSKIQDELFFDEKSKTWVLNERVSRSESLGKITETKVAFREGKEWIRIIRVIDSKTNLETEYIQSPKGLIKNSDLEFMKNYHFYYEYKFDSHQNWLEKKEMQKVSKFGRISFEPFRILKREIAYYE